MTERDSVTRPVSEFEEVGIVARLLARAVLRGEWFHRSQAWREGQHDRSWCSHCKGEGGYHEYTVAWHERHCPVRIAARLLELPADAPVVGYGLDE